MHVNDIFLFFKKLFLILAHQNDPKYINHIRKKNLNFFRTRCKYNVHSLLQAEQMIFF
jgi:hypothetical protein